MGKSRFITLVCVIIVAAGLAVILILWSLGRADTAPKEEPTAGGVGQVTGWVTGNDGLPVPDCYVDRIPDDPAISVEDIGVVTDEDGKFEVRLAEGRWMLRFQCSDAADRSEQTVEVKDGETTEVHVDVATR
ncbi:MAG: DUF1416 domain-containing protein [Bifidobacteriaceae bacterium]|jgi:hypothetical protein|nr:DUF1416 domain-containing protein [Bifidobacteriaceae bacterium]